jgi:hypothetical protein
MENDALRDRTVKVTRAVVLKFRGSEKDIVEEQADDYLSFGGAGVPAKREQALSGVEQVLLTSVVVPVVVDLLKDATKKSLSWVIEQLGRRRAPLPEHHPEIAQHIIEQLNDDS